MCGKDVTYINYYLMVRIAALMVILSCRISTCFIAGLP